MCEPAYSCHFLSLQTSEFQVWLGAETLENESPNRVIRRVSNIIKHPLYSSYRLDNDIALMKLSSRVTFNNYTRPVCLAKSGSKYERGSCWITGFGYIKTHSKISMKPIELNVCYKCSLRAPQEERLYFFMSTLYILVWIANAGCFVILFSSTAPQPRAPPGGSGSYCDQPRMSTNLLK